MLGGNSVGPRCIEMKWDQSRADKKEAVAVEMYLPSRSDATGGADNSAGRKRLSGEGVGISREGCNGDGGRFEVCESGKVKAVPVVKEGSLGFGGLGGNNVSCCRGPTSHKCLSTMRWKAVVSSALKGRWVDLLRQASKHWPRKW